MEKLAGFLRRFICSTLYVATIFVSWCAAVILLEVHANDAIHTISLITMVIVGVLSLIFVLAMGIWAEDKRAKELRGWAWQFNSVSVFVWLIMRVLYPSFRHVFTGSFFKQAA